MNEEPNIQEELLETDLEQNEVQPEEIPNNEVKTENALENSTEQNLKKIKEFTEEDEIKSSSSTSLSNILGGEFLTAKLVRDQLPLIVLIALFFVVYISNRYTNQAELIEIDNLKKELDDARFNALTRSSELTARSRQSYVEDYLKNGKDSLLQISSNSPYVISLQGESILPDAVEEPDLVLEVKHDSIIVD